METLNFWMNKDYFSMLFTQNFKMVMQIGISSTEAQIRSIRVAAPSGPDFCCQAAGLVKSGYPKIPPELVISQRKSSRCSVVEKFWPSKNWGNLGFVRVNMVAQWPNKNLGQKFSSGWWFGTLIYYDFPIILGMSSSQLLLTPSFLRGGRAKNHQPEYHLRCYHSFHL